MRRLIFHVGSHKTGTTTLQSAMRYAGKTGELGSWTFLTGTGSSKFLNLLQFSGRKKNFEAELNWNRFRDILDQSSGDCIISLESFFFLHRAKQIEELSAFLRGYFDQTQIVMYLRRQDQLALSHRKQIVTGRPAGKFYGVDVRALPEFRPYFNRYFDYARKVELWANGFGEDNVIIRRYEAGALKNGDTVTDFFDILGLPPVRGVDRKNIAMGREQLIAGLWMLENGFPAKSYLPIISKWRDDTRLMPSYADAEAFLAHFEESNRALARRCDPDGPELYFDHDLSKYPNAGNDDISDLLPRLETLRRKVEKRQRR